MEKNWITPEQVEWKTRVNVSTLYSWIHEGCWTEGVEYKVMRGSGHAGRYYLIDESLFSAFKPEETYLTGREAAQLLEISESLFSVRYTDKIVSVPVPSKNKMNRRMYALSSVLAYKKARENLFVEDEEYLNQDEAAVYLGVTIEYIRQLRTSNRLPGAIYKEASRHRWWYPFSSLKTHKEVMKQKKIPRDRKSL